MTEVASKAEHAALRDEGNVEVIQLVIAAPWAERPAVLAILALGIEEDYHGATSKPGSSSSSSSGVSSELSAKILMCSPVNRSVVLSERTRSLIG